MQLSKICCLAIMAAAIGVPISVSGQTRLPSLQPRDVTGGRGQAARAKQDAALAAQYTYGAVPAQPAERQAAAGQTRQLSGLINPFFTRPEISLAPGGRSGMLVLPVLAGTPATLADLSLQSLYMPPRETAESAGHTAAAAPNPNSPYMPPAPMVAPYMLKTVAVPSGLSIVIAPTILGYTEDIPPAFYGKMPEQTGTVAPTFSVLSSESLALQPATLDEVNLASLGLRDVSFTGVESAGPPQLFRLDSRMMNTRVIPWRVAPENVPQAPEAEGPGFRLPRAIQSLVNVNLHFGLGIPNFHPNIGSLTQSYLGLSGVYNYLSPDISERFQAPYYQQSRQPYP